MAEDAEELSYIEICKKNQYKEEFKQNNTWDLDYCPSKTIDWVLKLRYTLRKYYNYIWCTKDIESLKFSF